MDHREKMRIEGRERFIMDANTLEMKAHELLGQLGSNQLAAVVQLLEVLVHDENDELTDEDRRVVAASREYFRQGGEGVTFEQVVGECFHPNVPAATDC